MRSVKPICFDLKKRSQSVTINNPARNNYCKGTAYATSVKMLWAIETRWNGLRYTPVTFVADGSEGPPRRMAGPLNGVHPGRSELDSNTEQSTFSRSD